MNETPKLALVEPIYESNYLDVPSTLRVLADEIEKGKYGEVSCLAVSLLGDTLEVFGMGPDSSGTSTHLTLCAGARKFEMALVEHGE